MVIFDLDDTLFKRVDFDRSAYWEIGENLQAMFSKGGIKEWLIINMPLEKDPSKLLWKMKDHFDIDCNQQLIETMYRQHEPHIQLDCVTKQTLHDLIHSHVKIGLLVHNGCSALVRNKIKALDLMDYFKPENILIRAGQGYIPDNTILFKYFERNYRTEPLTYVGTDPYLIRMAMDRYWRAVVLLDDGNNVTPYGKVTDYRAPDFAYRKPLFINSLSELLKLVRQDVLLRLPHVPL